MNNQLTPYHTSPFDAILLLDENGQEYWSARDLQELLDYTEWRNFEDAIERGSISCKNNGHNPSDHFVAANKMIKTGKGAERSVDDFNLTRLGCYFTAMNGDPRKEKVSQAQLYFVVKTREAENAKSSRLALQDTAQLQKLEQMVNAIRIEMRNLRQELQPTLSRKDLKERVLHALQEIKEDYPDGICAIDLVVEDPWIATQNYSTSTICRIADSLAEQGLIKREIRNGAHYFTAL